MKRRYYIRKSPDCPWKEISGHEFYQIVTSPEGRDRYFTKIGNAVFEVPKQLHDKWNQQDRHSEYLRAQAEKWTEISFYSDMVHESLNGEEALMDPDKNVEAEALRNAEIEALRAALEHLDAASYQLIDALYLADCRKSEYDLAREYGVSQSAIHKRKKKILEILKKLVVNG